MMWDIVYADGDASETEDSIMWRIAGMLGVSERELGTLRQTRTQAIGRSLRHETARQGPLPVLITGASGGIGADLARLFARHGHPLALVARSGSALDALSREIAEEGSPPPVTCALDLSSPESPGILAGFLASQGFAPGILVNTPALA